MKLHHFTRQWVAPYLIVAITLLLLATPAAYYVQGNHADEGLRAAQARSCDASNAVRHVADQAITTLGDIQIDVLNDQIAQNASIPPKFFPSIPRRQFHRLQRVQARKERGHIEEIRRLERTVGRVFAPRPCSM